MKKINLIGLLLGLLMIMPVGKILYAQESTPHCRVLLHTINDYYEGGCKNGFAHGKGIARGEDVYEGKFKMGLPHGIGTYTWANGNTYTGAWKKGEMNGIGTYYSASNGEQVKGVWKNNEFIKEYEGPEYKVTYKSTAIERVEFYKMKGGIPGTIDIELRRDGYKNENVDFLLLNGSTGSQEVSYQVIGFRGVSYPFTGNVKFQAKGRTGFTTVNNSIDFKIMKEGAWKIVINY